VTAAGGVFGCSHHIGAGLVVVTQQIQVASSRGWCIFIAQSGSGSTGVPLTYSVTDSMTDSVTYSMTLTVIVVAGTRRSACLNDIGFDFGTSAGAIMVGSSVAIGAGVTVTSGVASVMISVTALPLQVTRVIGITTGAQGTSMVAAKVQVVIISGRQVLVGGPVITGYSAKTQTRIPFWLG